MLTRFADAVIRFRSTSLFVVGGGAVDVGVSGGTLSKQPGSRVVYLSYSALYE